jgi:hypothetical protein
MSYTEYMIRRAVMDNVYVVQEIDHTRVRIRGVFAAEGLAEIARQQLWDNLSEDSRDYGVFFRIVAFELGKVYQ